MVQAGEVFKDLDGTELFARMINDEKLFMQIEESINIAVQAMNEKIRWRKTSVPGCLTIMRTSISSILCNIKSTRQ